MTDRPPQFVAGAVSGGAVAQDGREITIEFEGGGSLLWISLPSALLPALQETLRELDALAIDARNGVAKRWHVAAAKDEPDRD